VHVAHECRERTAEQYRSTFKHHVYPAIGELPLGELKRSHIRALLASKAGLSRNTLKNILVPLRAMLNAAVDEERIPGNPAIRVPKRKRGQTEDEARKVTTLTEEELSRVLRAADEHCPDHADVIYLLAWTGLRISETCGLQWGDLDLGGHFLSVNRAVAYRQHRLIVGAPKSGKSRRVDLPEALVVRLRARQSVSEAEAAVAGREPSPWVFPAPSDDTKPMNAAFLRFKVWYRLLRRAEVRSIRIHDLRHTYASLLLLAGEPMLYVKEQLGHSTVQVTVDFYGHIRPGLNRGAVNRLAEATRPGTPALELHSDYTSERR
jgi:integrase